MENNEVVLIGALKWVKAGESQAGNSWARFHISVERPPLNGQPREPLSFKCKAFGENAAIIDQYGAEGTMIRLSGHLVKEKEDGRGEDSKWIMVVEVSDEDGSIMMLQDQPPVEAPPEQRNPIRRSKYDSEQMRAATPEETEEYWAEQGLDVSADDLPF